MPHHLKSIINAPWINPENLNIKDLISQGKIGIRKRHHTYGYSAYMAYFIENGKEILPRCPIEVTEATFKFFNKHSILSNANS